MDAAAKPPQLDTVGTTPQLPPPPVAMHLAMLRAFFVHLLRRAPRPAERARAPRGGDDDDDDAARSLHAAHRVVVCIVA